jgi:tRNA pseudouridine38-40 synthase
VNCYLMEISYEGTQYLGWQKQSKGKTIQALFEQILSKILNQPIKVHGSGRTDAKVHALGQTAHFLTNKIIDVKQLLISLNSLLPDDIAVNKIKRVNENFHARYSATSKHYRYLIHTGKKNPLLSNFQYHIRNLLNIETMNEAGQLFIGSHDFGNFTTKQSDDNNFIRTIYQLKITKRAMTITIDIIGSGFMKYMVRLMVGTLIAIGQDKIDKSFIEQNLNNNNHVAVRYKAPPHGLYLVKVNYEK